MACESLPRSLLAIGDWRFCSSVENTKLGGRFGYFLFFLLGGGGKEESEVPGGGGVGFLLKIPRGGGGFQEREVFQEGVCGEWGNFLGEGGAKYFVSGPKRPPSKKLTKSDNVRMSRLVTLAEMQCTKGKQQ